MVCAKSILWLVCMALLTGCKKDSPDAGGAKVEAFEPKPVSKPNTMGVWVHYMPWFEDPASSGTGRWGQHWTMANRNPDMIDAQGRRQVAAHYYPLIGPYASNDRDVLEYHFLLMKYAGVDGIWIDWYGTRNLYDYPLIKRNTEVIVDVLEQVGLRYAIVYEDQTLRDGFTTDGQRMVQATADMRYMETEFFSDDHYFRLDGKPVLFNFGPQSLRTPAAWQTVLGSIADKPAFYTLYGHSHLANDATRTNAQGEFIWVDATSMQTKYARKDEVGTLFGGAYPGFHDFYKEGGWGDQVLTPIDHEGGALMRRLLRMAADEGVPHVQLITWNDFGEGTMIEPTNEFGYTFLESVQEFTGVTYRKSVLEGIHRYYIQKKSFAADSAKKQRLLQAFYYYISLQQDKAAGIINELEHAN